MGHVQRVGSSLVYWLLPFWSTQNWPNFPLLDESILKIKVEKKSYRAIWQDACDEDGWWDMFEIMTRLLTFTILTHTNLPKLSHLDKYILNQKKLSSNLTRCLCRRRLMGQIGWLGLWLSYWLLPFWPTQNWPNLPHLDESIFKIKVEKKKTYRAIYAGDGW